MGKELVTVSTDGFRDYVELPDGRTLNLGSLSVLRLITTLVSSSGLCRSALDKFLNSGSTIVKVDVDRLVEMLKPRRSRWAGKDLIAHTVESNECSAKKGSGMDEVAKHELEEFLENDSRTLKLKEDVISSILGKPKYDHNYAKRLWLIWVDGAAESYAKKFDEDDNSLFPNALRDAVARDIADKERKLIDEGEYAGIKTASDGESMANPVEVSGTSEEVAKQMGVDNPYAGKDQSVGNKIGLKLAAEAVPYVNEGLIHLVASKVEQALQAVQGSQKKGGDVAKNDLHVISTRLSGLTKTASMEDHSLHAALLDLAKKADTVRSFFE
jgi:hypothetical protein